MGVVGAEVTEKDVELLVKVHKAGSIAVNGKEKWNILVGASREALERVGGKGSGFGRRLLCCVDWLSEVSSVAGT